MNRVADNSPAQTYFRALTWLQWLVLPAIAGLYAVSWNQLPCRLATHFDFSNQPNGWMSREASLVLMLLIAVLMSATATWVLSRVSKPDAPAWALMLLFYIIGGTLLWATDSIIAYNTVGTPVNIGPVLLIGIAAAVLVMVLALATRRGAKLPPANLIAEESHASILFTAILGLPAIGFVVLAASMPLLWLRIVMGLALLMILTGTAMAGSGFHYFFSPAGVEIRTLGFRLRSIPARAIRSYAVDRWNFAGGYGIRGVGNRRAYVWGNRGVKIDTDEAEVFLGHSDPDRIVHDLDLVLNNHEAHQAPPGSL